MLEADSGAGQTDALKTTQEILIPPAAVVFAELGISEVDCAARELSIAEVHAIIKFGFAKVDRAMKPGAGEVHPTAKIGVIKDHYAGELGTDEVDLSPDELSTAEVDRARELGLAEADRAARELSLAEVEPCQGTGPG